MTLPIRTCGKPVRPRVPMTKVCARSRPYPNDSSQAKTVPPVQQQIVMRRVTRASRRCLLMGNRSRGTDSYPSTPKSPGSSHHPYVFMLEDVAVALGNGR